MKLSLLILIFFFILELVYCQTNYRNPDVPLSNSMTPFDLIHVISSSKHDTVDIKMGDKIGTVEEYPDKLSEKFDKEIRISMKYYDKKDFISSKTVLEIALAAENQNPFILNAYPRACYFVDRPTSFIVYKNLIVQLDSTYKNSESITVVDIWFRDAYWKLGTLYMDYKEWEKACYEISRFVLTIQEAKG